MLRLYDTARRERTQLTPGTPGQVTVYVCGPTVYDDPHLGHGRMAVVFDTLRRTLARRVAPVRFVSNITDVDDKIIARARERGVAPAQLAARYEARWWEAMDALGVERPTETPHASAWIAEMVRVAERLLALGHAYETQTGIYLSVADVPDYGLLKHQDLAELRAGARIEPDEAKRSPLDFALWKRVSPEDYGYASPLGWGRPGWHTECVVMSTGLLGETFDLHGGGLDLAFPHHENERAQAALLGMPFAQHWMHNGFVELAGEKMSKSLGNTLDLHGALGRFGGRTVRLAYLRAHYRSPVELGEDALVQAAAQLARLDELARTALAEEAEQEDLERFDAALAEDLDTPAALAELAEVARAARAAARAGERAPASRRSAAVAAMLAALGLAPARAADVPEEVRALVTDREAAKRERDWPRADALRSRIGELGWQVRDTPSGPELVPLSDR
jgi:cysteinyl-tRNA synthetase